MRYPETLITRYPEAPRRRVLTVRPKAARPCIISAIQRYDDRQAAIVIGFARIDRREAR
ncbi:hypothetical protein [Acidiphilium multivorum]|uniref:hypothetical protein n=1 Tax=Acidiphilium multivorum TaxID=62140 RepID=UPI001B8D3859|nr:hypothetical protein [Acidiphilium multivorum]